MQIIVKVDDKVIITKKRNIGTNNVKTIECLFELCNEFVNMIPIAIFTKDNISYKVNIIDNKCLVPHEVLKSEGEVEFGVYGFVLEGAELVKRYSPVPTVFIVREGSYKEGQESVDASPSSFEFYLSACNNAKNDAETSENNAKSSEENAKNSEENSKISEENAKLSEENSKISENNAQTSANNAKAIEEEVENIKNSIVTEENKRVENENARVTAENERQISEDNRIQNENVRVANEISREEERKIHNDMLDTLLKDMQVESTDINVKDSADYPCELRVEGKSEQEVTENSPSPNYPSTIENVSGDLAIKVVGKNLWNQPKDLDLRDVTVGHSNPYIVSPILTVYQYSVGNTLGAYFKNHSIILDTQKGPIVRGKITGLKPNTTYTISYFLKTNATKTIYRTLCSNATVSTTKFNTKVAYSFTTDDIGEFGGYSESDSSIIWLNQDERPEIEYQDIMLVEDSYTAETMPKFEAYKEQTVTFPLSEGQKMYKDSYLADDGIHHKRKTFVFTGTENIQSRKTTDDIATYSAVVITDYKRTNNLQVLCSHFSYGGTVESIVKMYTKGECIAFYDNENNSDKLVYINSKKLTVAELKSYLAEQYANGTPVIVEYELAEEEIVPYTQEQRTAYEQLQKLKTYRTVTNISNNQNTNMKLTYKKDLQTQLLELENMILESGV